MKCGKPIAAMAGGDGQSEPLKEVTIAAGGKKVAAYRGASQTYGAWNTLVYVFLDEGRLFFAVGPKESFDEKALVNALTALVATHPANELLYQHPKQEAIAAPRPDPCGIPGLKGEFDVVVVSVSRGSTPVDIALDKSGRDVFREDVVVGTTEKPVVLVLMGDDPIVWNVGLAKGARIAGVLAEGRYPPGGHRPAKVDAPDHLFDLGRRECVPVFQDREGRQQRVHRSATPDQGTLRARDRHVPEQESRRSLCRGRCEWRGRLLAGPDA